MKIISVPANSTGVKISGALVDTDVRCAWSASSLGILIDNDLDNAMSNITGSGGYLLKAFKCKSLRWIKGGSSGATHQYGAYLGDLLQWKEAKNVLFDNLKFVYAKHQAIIRAMGAELQIKNCSFNQTGNEGNEAFQLRHGRFYVENTSVMGSVVIGTLEPGQAGQDAMRKYLRDNYKNPAWTHFLTPKFTGHFRVVGSCPVLIDGGVTLGKDPRGGSPSFPFTVKYLNTEYGTHKPTLIVMNHEVRGYKYFAGDNVIIGPGCTLDGKKVPTRKWGVTSMALAAKIREEAVKYS